MNRTATTILNILFACLLGLVPMSIIWCMLWSTTSAVVISAVGGCFMLMVAAIAYSHVDPHPI